MARARGLSSVIHSWGGAKTWGESETLGGDLKKFSPAAGIVNDVFCWRVSSEPPNFFQEGLCFAV